MADFALDAVYEYEEIRHEYRTGNMNITQAIESGVVDELGYEYIAMKKQKEKTCKCCGETGLRWGKINNKFVLMKSKSIHKCPIRPLEII